MQRFKMIHASFMVGLAAAAVLSGVAHAAPILFDFTSTPTQASPLVVTQSGLTATVVAADNGVLDNIQRDSNNNFIGVAGPGSTSTAGGAANNQISGLETLTLTFDQSVFLLGADYFGVGQNADAGVFETGIFKVRGDSGGDVDYFENGVELATPAGYTFEGTNDVLTVGSLLIPAGTPLVFLQDDINGSGSAFGLQSVTVELVPEPASLALLGLGGLCLLSRRRR